jgi:leader peptidase (prepilin peptidase)/N-methyltransferase
VPLPGLDAVAVPVAALAGAGGGLAIPRVLARLPPPAPSADPAPAALPGPGAGRWLVARCALAAATSSAVVGWRLGWSPGLPAWVYLCVVGVLLAYVDWRTRLLPTAVIAPSYAVLAALLLLASAVTGDWDAALRAGLGWVAVGGVFFALWFVHPRGLGYGDVRLSGLLGMALGWLGWAELVTGVYAGFCLGAVGGGLLSLLGVVDRRRYPFGPFLLLGSLMGVVWGPALSRWYAGG